MMVDNPRPRKRPHTDPPDSTDPAGIDPVKTNTNPTTAASATPTSTSAQVPARPAPPRVSVVAPRTRATGQARQPSQPRQSKQVPKPPSNVPPAVPSTTGPATSSVPFPKIRSQSNLRGAAAGQTRTGSQGSQKATMPGGPKKSSGSSEVPAHQNPDFQGQSVKQTATVVKLPPTSTTPAVDSFGSVTPRAPATPTTADTPDGREIRPAASNSRLRSRPGVVGAVARHLGQKQLGSTKLALTAQNATAISSPVAATPSSTNVNDASKSNPAVDTCERPETTAAALRIPAAPLPAHSRSISTSTGQQQGDLEQPGESVTTFPPNSAPASLPGIHSAANPAVPSYQQMIDNFQRKRSQPNLTEGIVTGQLPPAEQGNVHSSHLAPAMGQSGTATFPFPTQAQPHDVFGPSVPGRPVEESKPVRYSRPVDPPFGYPATAPFPLDAPDMPDLPLPRSYNAAYPHPLTAYASPGVNPATVQMSGYDAALVNLYLNDPVALKGTILAEGIGGEELLPPALTVLIEPGEGNGIPERLWSKFESYGAARVPVGAPQNSQPAYSTQTHMSRPSMEFDLVSSMTSNHRPSLPDISRYQSPLPPRLAHLARTPSDPQLSAQPYHSGQERQSEHVVSPRRMDNEATRGVGYLESILARRQSLPQSPFAATLSPDTRLPPLSVIAARTLENRNVPHYGPAPTPTRSVCRETGIWSIDMQLPPTPTKPSIYQEQLRVLAEAQPQAHLLGIHGGATQSQNPNAFQENYFRTQRGISGPLLTPPFSAEDSKEPFTPTFNPDLGEDLSRSLPPSRSLRPSTSNISLNSSSSWSQTRRGSLATNLETVYESAERSWRRSESGDSAFGHDVEESSRAREPGQMMFNMVPLDDKKEYDDGGQGDQLDTSIEKPYIPPFRRQVPSPPSPPYSLQSAPVLPPVTTMSAPTRSFTSLTTPGPLGIDTKNVASAMTIPSARVTSDRWSVSPASLGSATSLGRTLTPRASTSSLSSNNSFGASGQIQFHIGQSLPNHKYSAPPTLGRFPSLSTSGSSGTSYTVPTVAGSTANNSLGNSISSAPGGSRLSPMAASFVSESDKSFGYGSLEVDVISQSGSSSPP